MDREVEGVGCPVAGLGQELDRLHVADRRHPTALVAPSERGRRELSVEGRPDTAMDLQGDPHRVRRAGLRSERDELLDLRPTDRVAAPVEAVTDDRGEPLPRHPGPLQPLPELQPPVRGGRAGRGDGHGGGGVPADPREVGRRVDVVEDPVDDRRSSREAPARAGATSETKVRSAAGTPPSGNAWTSWVPVLAPLGAATTPTLPSEETTVTSTVGFPRLSYTWRIREDRIRLMAPRRTPQGHRGTTSDGQTLPGGRGRRGATRCRSAGTPARRPSGASRRRSGRGTPHGGSRPPVPR